MTTTRVQTLPATWDAARDLPFFHITERLFSPGFCFGAGVLLASYDDDDLSAPAAASHQRPSTTTPTSADGHTELRAMSPTLTADDVRQRDGTRDGGSRG